MAKKRYSRSKRNCVHCGSKKIRRDHRKGFMQKYILPLFDGYPYHCRKCKATFILFVGAELPPPPAPPMILFDERPREKRK